MLRKVKSLLLVKTCKELVNRSNLFSMEQQNSIKYVAIFIKYSQNNSQDLITKFQTKFNLKLDGSDENYTEDGTVHKSLLSCHRCLIFLGDLGTLFSLTTVLTYVQLVTTEIFMDTVLEKNGLKQLVKFVEIVNRCINCEFRLLSKSFAACSR
jgi:hypothetical protein